MIRARGVARAEEGAAAGEPRRPPCVAPRQLLLHPWLRCAVRTACGYSERSRNPKCPRGARPTPARRPGCGTTRGSAWASWGRAPSSRGAPGPTLELAEDPRDKQGGRNRPRAPGVTPGRGAVNQDLPAGRWLCRLRLDLGSPPPRPVRPRPLRPFSDLPDLAVVAQTTRVGAHPASAGPPRPPAAPAPSTPAGLKSLLWIARGFRLGAFLPRRPHASECLAVGGVGVPPPRGSQADPTSGPDSVAGEPPGPTDTATGGAHTPAAVHPSPSGRLLHASSLSPGRPRAAASGAGSPAPPELLMLGERGRWPG